MTQTDTTRLTNFAFTLSIDKLKTYCNPLSSVKGPWEGIVTVDMVREALEQGRLADYSDKPSDHAARVAYFVKNPSDHPIDIDVGVLTSGFFAFVSAAIAVVNGFIFLSMWLSGAFSDPVSYYLSILINNCK